MDTRPGAEILQDPRVSNYQPDPRLGEYQNKSKGFIEDPGLSPGFRDALKEAEKLRAEKYFGRSSPGFIIYNSLAAAEEERPEFWASWILR